MLLNSREFETMIISSICTQLVATKAENKRHWGNFKAKFHSKIMSSYDQPERTYYQAEFVSLVILFNS